MSLISARLLRLEHARLSQRNGEETIERRYRQYLRIEPHIPSQRNASFIVRGYPTDHARSVRSTGAIGKWSYDSRRNSQRERQTRSIRSQVDRRRPGKWEDTDPKYRINSPPGCSRTQSHWLTIGRRMYVFPGGNKTCPSSPQTLALRTIAFNTKAFSIPSSDCLSLAPLFVSPRRMEAKTAGKRGPQCNWRAQTLSRQREAPWDAEVSERRAIMKNLGIQPLTPPQPSGPKYN
jgi:hypothetical protein